jgi:hypothetical protein
MLTRPGKNTTRQRVHDRIRKKVLGTAERPRLNVYRSLNHIYVQVIDDLNGVTLVAASTAEGKESGPPHRRQRRCRKGRRKDDRRSRKSQGHRESCVRPRWIHLSRARKSCC